MIDRIILIVMDSVGIGELPDANLYGDAGSNTLGNIVRRMKGFELENLEDIGLGNIDPSIGLKSAERPKGSYGRAKEISPGKDTTTGHWEIAGVPVTFEWGFFPKEAPSFPQEFIDEFVAAAKIPGILGNCHASGTDIINKHGDEHVKTGKLICYTSADSVFQIAAHEESFGLDRLYEICKIAFELIKPYNIGRIIARPFLGANGKYERTEHRRDFSVSPPDETLLDKVVAAGGTTIAIGKIADIFAHRGISKHVDAHGDREIFAALFDQLKNAPDRSLSFANFVDFDMKYGHRRDVAGYAKALEAFDKVLPEFIAQMQPGDIAVITADHGCDPTFKGSDHTREYIPILVFGPDIKPGSIGKRDTFADIGQSLAKYLDLAPLKFGKSFL